MNECMCGNTASHSKTPGPQVTPSSIRETEDLICLIILSPNKINFHQFKSLTVQWASNGVGMSSPLELLKERCMLKEAFPQEVDS